MSDKLSKALYALIKKRASGAVFDVLSELASADTNASHDRTLAIVGAVYLEDALRNAISKHLMPARLPDTRAIIFEDDQAPLSGLASRTRMAYALGIIPDDLRKDIGVIRVMRNAFAHSSDGFTFNHPDIKSSLVSLSILQSVNLEDVRERYPEHLERCQFVIAVSVLCGLIDQHHGEWVGSELVRKSLADALQSTPPQQSPLAQKKPKDTPTKS
ncbi:MAG TPA: hypothetical protein VMI56_16810 [Reyranella sp.]|nr:hypothetical protein [Reyranella sp.]